MPEATPDHAPALELEGAGVSRWSAKLGRRVALLAGVDWRVARGEHWAVLGPNGAGKTTLLHLSGALTHATEGTVHVLGARIGGVDLRVLRERIGFVDARLDRALRPASPAREIVLTGAFSSIALQRRRLTPEHGQRADALMGMVGAGELADRRFDDCSRGERQRVLLARALMTDPDLLLLDEPATGLDLPSRERLVRALTAMAGERPELTTITVTHHVEEIPPTTTHALLLRDGEVLAQGPAPAVLTGELVSACFGVPVEVGHRSGRFHAMALLAD